MTNFGTSIKGNPYYTINDHSKSAKSIKVSGNKRGWGEVVLIKE